MVNLRWSLKDVLLIVLRRGKSIEICPLRPKLARDLKALIRARTL